jgi:type IV pilus assembly protein PilB
MPEQKLDIADILMAVKVITPEQRERADKLAAQSRCLFGEAVVRLGFAKEDAIALALSKKMGLPFASKENRLLKVQKHQKLEDLVPENFAREHALVPLFRDSSLLAVAMWDPTNISVRENLKLLTHCEIQPFVSTKVQIYSAIDDFYQQGSRSMIDKTIEKIAAAPLDAKAGGDDMESLVTRVDLDSAATLSEDAHTIALVNAILKQAVAERASDIHLESYDQRVVLRFRIDGTLYERAAPLKKDFMAIVARIKILAKLDIAERRLPQDGTFSIKVHDIPIDLRISICPTVYGEKVVMRILANAATELNIDALGFEPRQRTDFLDAANQPHGLIFITGPTGSGKTTTLYTVLNTIKTPELNFMTIEDPVEIKLSGISQVQVRANIGLTFASALRSFLRQDPDVILVGEVRDAETAQTCLRAALTGHLVLSTLHTNDALSAVVRLVDMGIEPYLLAGSLMLVAAQRLVRVLCPECRKPYEPPAEEWDEVVRGAMLDSAPPTSRTFYKPSGCQSCYNTGYKGRRAIYEIYRINQDMRRIISKDKGDLTKLQAAAAKTGMWNMRASGFRKVLLGQTTIGEVHSATVEE